MEGKKKSSTSSSSSWSPPPSSASARKPGALRSGALPPPEKRRRQWEDEEESQWEEDEGESEAEVAARNKTERGRRTSVLKKVTAEIDDFLSSQDVLLHAEKDMRRVSELEGELLETQHLLREREDELERLRRRLHLSQNDDQPEILQQQLREARKTIYDLEQYVGRKELENKKLRVEMESELAKRERELRREKEKAVERDLKYERIEEEGRGQKDLQPILKQKEGAIKSLKETVNQLEEKMGDLSTQNSKLRQLLSDAEHTSREERTELQSQLQQLSEQLNLMNVEQEALSEKYERCRTQLQHATKKAAEMDDLHLQLAQANLKLKELSAAENAPAELSAINASMHEELRRLQMVERDKARLLEENKYLKEVEQEVVLLREEKRGLSSQLRICEQHLEDYSELKVKYDGLQERLSKWEQHLGDMSEFESPAHLTNHISELRKQIEIASEQNGQLNAELKRATAAKQVSEGVSSQLKQELEQTLSELEVTKESLRRKELWAKIAERERDGLRDLLKTYEEAAFKDNASAESQTEQQHLFQQQVLRLEEQLKERDMLVRSLQEQLDQQQQKSTAREEQEASQRAVTSNINEEEMERMKKELEFAVREIKKLNAENDKLSVQLSHYEARVGKGDFDPATTKVLHMTINPTSEFALPAEIDRLRSENKALKTRLEKIKANTEQHHAAEGTDMDVVGGGSGIGEETAVLDSFSYQKLQAENESLKQSLKEGEKSNKRLMEIFHKKITEFRETVYLLFGWKVNAYEEKGHKRYQLKCIYREHQEEDLVFLVTKDGMQLLETEFSGGLQNHIQTFLVKYNSIPSFLAMTTLDLFKSKRSSADG